MVVGRQYQLVDGVGLPFTRMPISSKSLIAAFRSRRPSTDIRAAEPMRLLQDHVEYGRRVDRKRMTCKTSPERDAARKTPPGFRVKPAPVTSVCRILSP